MRDFVVCDIPYRDRRFTAAALVDEGRIRELILEEADRPSYVSEVRRGIVETVSRNIGGAFVDIGLKSLCFLPLGRHSHIAPSQPVLVQVTKDAAGRKEPVLTETIHLSGRYAVLLSRGEKTSFSAKLSEEEKAAVRKWLTDQPPRYSLLVRTNAGRASKAEVLAEIEALSLEMDRILEQYPKSASGEVLWRPAPFYEDAVRDLYCPPDRCFTDIPSAAVRLSRFTDQAAGVGEEIPGAVLRPGAGKALTLAELYGIPHELDRLTQKIVWLKSGAFLVIEQTEAFVSIDVNTGKCIKGRIPEETYRKVNLEAAEEIARQLRLRNLSGMILVDFIKLKSEDHKSELLHVMRKHVRHDHIRTEAVDLTPLGIMEITRQKVRKPLAEVLGLC